MNVICRNFKKGAPNEARFSVAVTGRLRVGYGSVRYRTLGLRTFGSWSKALRELCSPTHKGCFTKAGSSHCPLTSGSP